MDLIDALLDPWRSGISRRALAEVMLLGCFCGALAFWVVRERLSYAAESLAHGLLPGLVLAALAGLPLVLGAAGGAAVAAVLIALAGWDERIGPETATAVAVTGLLGLGGLLALAPEAPPRLGELLFGDPLGASDGDLAGAAALLVLGGGALAALHRPLGAIAFDPDGAAAARLPVGRVRLALLALLAVAVVVAVRGLGNLLVLAALVAPAVAVARHARGPGSAMIAGAVLSALAGAIGVYVSFHAGAAAGACVALALCALAAAGAALPVRSAPRPRATSAGGPPATRSPRPSSPG